MDGQGVPGELETRPTGDEAGGLEAATDAGASRGELEDSGRLGTGPVPDGLSGLEAAPGG